MFLTLLAAAPLAFATPGLVTDLSDAAGMPCTPPCTVCHATNAGGGGTVTQPFGVALVDAGLLANDTPSLEAAVATLEADGTDSDEDGTPDIDELAAGEDPNGGPAFCADGQELVTPRYGCFSGDAGGAFLVFGAAGLGAALRRRVG